MNANELRINNWVVFSFGVIKYHQIVAKDIKVLTEYPDAEEYKPIPLTEEWLIKLGFQQFGAVTFCNESYFRYILGRNSMYSIDKILFIYAVNDHDLCEIKYVHQLQNLYFALTGVELQLSST